MRLRDVVCVKSAIDLARSIAHIDIEKKKNRRGKKDETLTNPSSTHGGRARLYCGAYGAERPCCGDDCGTPTCPIRAVMCKDIYNFLMLVQ
ncbi:hypothetical protein QE152_g7415 [Popillia japonica]|uniref:Uncharacterized protein n=1 Tax=Popillia japonica TaxID=7064 RepID=A0AAW1MF07_POPJA